MNGYSRIRLTNSSKSRFMDFSDLLSSPDHQTPEPIKETTPNPPSKCPQDPKSNGHPTWELEEYDQAEEDEGERFGEVLRRSCSVSSTAASASHSSFIRFNKQLSSSVKRAFSMRRSSSVSERYSRIHDQCVTTLGGVGPTSFDDPDEVVHTSSMKKKKQKQHRTSRILKTCKRIFGLQS